MGGQEPPNQIDSSALASAFSKMESSKPENLANMFDNMQISVVGGNPEELKSEVGGSEDESGDDGDDKYF